MYKILPYTRAQARRLGVKIAPSIRPGKKVDIFDRYGKYITSIGSKGYLDYPNYKKLFGKKIADQRRKMYKNRHATDRSVKWSRGWWADRLLW
jgi:hypothetical protein